MNNVQNAEILKFCFSAISGNLRNGDVISGYASLEMALVSCLSAFIR